MIFMNRQTSTRMPAAPVRNSQIASAVKLDLRAAENPLAKLRESCCAPQPRILHSELFDARPVRAAELSYVMSAGAPWSSRRQRGRPVQPAFEQHDRLDQPGRQHEWRSQGRQPEEREMSR